MSNYTVIDWHCPHCKYLHLKDNIYEDIEAGVRAKCIVCKRLVDLMVIETNKSWRYTNAE